MNRSDGLVQRKNILRETSEGVPNKDSQGASDKRDERGEDDLEEGDSKETRLTLMEEVLLLGLKDKEVSMTSGHPPSIAIVFTVGTFVFLLSHCK